MNVPDLELEVEETVFRGEVVFVDSEVQEVSQQVRIWAKVSNTDNLLKSGLIATMRIPRPNPRDIALKPKRQ